MIKSLRQTRIFASRSVKSVLDQLSTFVWLKIEQLIALENK
ncbi:hypothetical protein [Deinococcus ruber]|nr:hypothetical protein [Deinococcus ruber]